MASSVRAKSKRGCEHRSDRGAPVSTVAFYHHLAGNSIGTLRSPLAGDGVIRIRRGQDDDITLSARV